MAKSPRGMHPEEIKAQLRIKHGPIGPLSIAWGFNRNAITQTLRRPEYSQNVEKLIARALDIPLHVLWPLRWAPDGSALQRYVEFDPIPRRSAAASQNRKAA